MKRHTSKDPQALPTIGLKQGEPIPSPMAVVSPKRRSHPLLRYLLFAPSLLLILLFSYYPAVQSIVGSLTAWNGFSPPVFEGLQNFQSYVAQPAFGAEVRNLLLLVGGGTLISVIFPFLGAELVRALPTKWLLSSVKYLLVITMVARQVRLIDVWTYVLISANGSVVATLSV